MKGLTTRDIGESSEIPPQIIHQLGTRIKEYFLPNAHEYFHPIDSSSTTKEGSISFFCKRKGVRYFIEGILLSAVKFLPLSQTEKY